MKKPGLSLLLLALIVAIVATVRAEDRDTLKRLADLMHGRFDTHPPGLVDDTPEAERLIDARQRIHQPELGDVVFYLQLNRGADLSLYRQRILVLSLKDGAITQRAYTLRDPPRFVDAKSGDAVWSGFGMDDIELAFAEGCAQIWTAQDGAFVGHVDPANCRIISRRSGRPRRIEAETILTTEQLKLAERGYDDRMQQLFGTPQGDHSVLMRVQ